MTAGPLLESVIACGALVTAGALTACFWLRRSFRNARLESLKTVKEATAKLEMLSEEVETWRACLAAAEQMQPPVTERFATGASLHLNRRGQVAQLYRRGQTPRSIAAALGVSQGEVKLIIKLYDLKRSRLSAEESKNLCLKSPGFLDNASGVRKGDV